MIKGIVTDNREAIIRLTVRGPSGIRRQIEAIVDTGFNSCLSLPAEVVSWLELRKRGIGSAILADGSRCIFDVYGASVEWDGYDRGISVHEAEADPLLGMELLEGHELKLQVRIGGDVTIEPLS